MKVPVSAKVLREFAVVTVLITSLASARGAAAASSCSVENFTTPLQVAVTGEISDIFIDDQCQFVYVTNLSTNRLQVYSLQDKSLVKAVQVGSLPTSVDAGPDGQTLYVANSGSGYISVVSASQLVETNQVSTQSQSQSSSFPGPYPTEVPFSVAAASNGQVFITTARVGSSGGLNILQYNPATGHVTPRTDIHSLTDHTYLTTSGDRKVIGVTVGNVSSGPVYRYDVTTDTFGPEKDLEGPVFPVAFDRTGSVALTGPYVLDAAMNLSGTLAGVSGWGTVQPDGRTGYVVYNGAIAVVDLARFLKTGNLTASGAKGPITLSQDGKLLAVVTDTGFTVLRSDGVQSAATLRVLALSTAQTRTQSFFRFYNAGTQAGTVKVSLIDFLTSSKVAEWTSPSIPPGSAPQYSVREIEAAATQAYTKPYYYQAIIEPSIEGTFAHITWSPMDNVLTNLTTCDAGVTSVPDRLVNVHSSNLDYAYPSFVSVMNTGTTPAGSVRLGVYDARTGSNLGSYFVPTPIAAGTGQVIAMSVIEKGANIRPATGLNHYVIKSELPFTGYLQHLVNNLQSGVLTDMSTVCKLPQL